MSAMPMKIEQCKELVEYYLSLGLDVNAVDNQGLTPLHIIADSPYGNFIILLHFWNNIKHQKKRGELTRSGKHKWKWQSCCCLMVQIQH